MKIPIWAFFEMMKEEKARKNKMVAKGEREREREREREILLHK